MTGELIKPQEAIKIEIATISAKIVRQIPTDWTGCPLPKDAEIVGWLYAREASAGTGIVALVIENGDYVLIETSGGPLSGIRVRKEDTDGKVKQFSVEKHIYVT